MKRDNSKELINWGGILQVKRRKIIVIITALTLGVMLNTNIWTIQSKAEVRIKDNTYISNEVQANKLSQIYADKAKQEEIDRIAAQRANTASQAKVAADKAQQKAAGVESVNRTKIESAILATVGRSQTEIEAKLSSYLSSSANITSVLNRAVALHGGDPKNTCVYFSSEAMRRIGVAVPVATCNTGQYLSYLNAHAWVASYNIKELTPGTICFTTNGWDGYPTHTFAFIRWVTPGNYTSAYVADNQGRSVHVRNMGVTVETDAFAFYVRTPIPPTVINATPLYNSINISWSAVAGANGYEVYKATSSSAAYALLSRTTAISYNNTGITNNNDYYYKVRAYRMAGTVKVYSGYSSIVSAKLLLSVPTTETSALTPTTVYKNQVGVTSAITSIRTGAHVNYSVKGSFSKGIRLSILGAAGSFYKVSYNGISGYVSALTVSIVAPTPATIAKTLYGVTKAKTSVRTGAHTNYSVYATMPTGTKINITGVAGTFYRVTYNKRTGYVSSSTVTAIRR